MGSDLRRQDAIVFLLLIQRVDVEGRGESIAEEVNGDLGLVFFRSCSLCDAGGKATLY